MMNSASALQKRTTVAVKQSCFRYLTAFLLTIGAVGGLNAEQQENNSSKGESILVRDVPGELPTVFRGSELDRSLDTMVFFTLPNGSRSGIPVKELAAEVTLPAGNPEQWTGRDFSTKIKEVQSLSVRFPSLSRDISSIVDKLKQAASANVKRLIDQPVDTSLPEAKIKSLFAEMDALALSATEMRPHVEEAKRRWNAHLEKAAAEVSAQTVEENQKPGEKTEVTLDNPASWIAGNSLYLQPTVVTEEKMRVVFGVAVSALVAWLGMLGVYLFKRFSANRIVLTAGEAKGNRSRKPPGIFFSLLVVSSTACLAIGGFLIWKIVSAENATSQSILHKELIREGNVRSFEIPAEPDRVRAVCIPPEVVNDFFQNHLTIELPNPENVRFSLLRTGLAASPSESGPILVESLKVLDIPIVIEYHFPEGEGEDVPVTVTANAVPIPGLLASFLVDSLVQQLEQIFHKSRLGAQYEFVALSNKGLLLTPRGS